MHMFRNNMVESHCQSGGSRVWLHAFRLPLLLLVAVFALVFRIEQAEAAFLDWAAQTQTELLVTSYATTVSGVGITVTGSSTDPATDTSRILRVWPTVTSNGRTGGIASQMDATTDNGSVINSVTLTFAKPVSNVSFTIIDIDGGTGGSWNDTVTFSSGPVAAFPTATFVGSNVTYNATTGRATADGAAVSDTTGDLTVSFAGPLKTITINHIADAINFSSNPATQVIVIDDVTFTPTPTTVAVQKITVGSTAGPFAFTQTNLASNPANVTTTTAGVAAPVSPTPVAVTTIGSAVTVTEPPAFGFGAYSATCTDANSAVTGNTGSIGTLAGSTLTIPAASVTDGSAYTCVFTNRRATIAVQKISINGTDTFAFSGQTNLASTPSSIATSTVGTAAPASPSGIFVSAIGTDVTLTETAVTGYTLTHVSCSDSNSAATGNSGTFGTVSGSTVTVPAANIKAGAVITCQLTNAHTTIAIQKISLGGVGTFSFSSGTNTDVTSGSIVTTTSGVAAPAVGSLINVLTADIAITSQETPVTGYLLTGFVCTDANSSYTGTSGSFGGFSGNTITVPAVNVKAGAALNCVVTNTKLPTLAVSVVSYNGTTTFSYSGTNGWVNQNLTTVTPGVAVTGSTQILAGAGIPMSLTEAIPSGFYLTAVSCSGLGSGGTYTPSLTSGAVSFDAQATAPGATISCSFTNGVPVINLTKAVNSPSISAPGTLTYTISVSNAGTVPLTGLSLSDALLQGAAPRSLTTGPSFSSGDSDSDGVLDPSESWVYAASYAVTQANIDAGTSFSNTVTFDSAETIPTTSAPAVTTITVAPQLSIVKTANTPGPVSVGQIITYSFVVTNTGNVTFSNVHINETINAFGTPPAPANETQSGDFGTLGDSSDAVPNDGTWSTLAPGDVVTFTAPYTTVQADIDNLQ